eukprot:TRINITY_DN9961_c0_g1_i2.p3 TRINITY_DN9961_c0_g1~~TRINITY_DN9961_c0_g1_i2.p3  ORF type:complete len:114 (-),score=0.61 TRINITY_DN9961_c0_g1_i2:439-780(-)
MPAPPPLSEPAMVSTVFKLTSDVKKSANTKSKYQPSIERMLKKYKHKVSVLVVVVNKKYPAYEGQSWCVYVIKNYMHISKNKSVQSQKKRTFLEKSLISLKVKNPVDDLLREG